MLSQPERRQLREIERWLEESDPQLTHTLRAGVPKRRSLNRRGTRVALGVVAALVVVLGWAAENFPLVVCGVFLAVGVAIMGARRADPPADRSGEAGRGGADDR